MVLSRKAPQGGLHRHGGRIGLEAQHQKGIATRFIGAPGLCRIGGVPAQAGLADLGRRLGGDEIGRVGKVGRRLELEADERLEAFAQQ